MDNDNGRSRVATRNRGNTQRSHPYERDNAEGGQQRRHDEEDLEVVPANSIKVSGSADVNTLAQQICDSCRDQDPHTLLTIGNQSINQAVKGIAVAHAELAKDNLCLSFQPAFRDENRTRPLIAFYLSTTRLRQSDNMEDVDEASHLTVASHSKIKPVAGAIAGRVRENKFVIVTAIGVDAVTNAVLAAGNARLFLEKEGLDIKVQPAFTKLTKNGSEISALRFTCISEPI